MLAELLDYDVRSCCQHHNSGDHCEEGEGDETDPVQHHGRELPVILYIGRLVLAPDLVADHPDLLENVDKFSVYSWIFSKLLDCHRGSENIVNSCKSLQMHEKWGFIVDVKSDKIEITWKLLQT